MDDTFVAIDLGAGSGRVVAGSFPESGVDLRELHRFPNRPRFAGGHERWDFGALMAGILEGLRRLPDGGRGVTSVGADSWGVDYGLIDAGGKLIEDPVCYRDPRTAGAREAVFARIPREELFAITGLQVQPFNTIYQLVAHRRSGRWPADAARLLLIPDLVHHALGGEPVAEVTDASTTQLLDARNREWSAPILERLDIPRSVMPPLVRAGTRLGVLGPAARIATGLGPIPIVAPATHDTASAFAGTPLGPDEACLSSGTWSLFGVELPAPLLDPGVAAENFTNEAGAFGTTRLLRNVMGLWILEECRRGFAAAGSEAGLDTLLAAVASAPPLRAFVDPDDPRFFHPAGMEAEIRALLGETGQPPPEGPAHVARIVLESLALRYAEVLADLERLTGRRIRAIRVVGGGARNAFLNQATADAAGREVLAGPAEATALGNLLLQAVAAGRFRDLDEGRAFVAASFPPERFAPRGDPAWDGARRRFRDLRPHR